MSVRIEQLGTTGRIFIKFKIWIFFEIYRKNHVSLKSEKNNRYLRKESRIFLTICRYILLKMRKSLDKIAEKIKTNYILRDIFFRKSRRLWDNVEKYVRAMKATDDNILQRRRFACWITKTTHTHTIVIYNIYCSCTAAAVMRTPLSVTLYVHCLFCSWLWTATPGVYC